MQIETNQANRDDSKNMKAEAQIKRKNDPCIKKSRMKRFIET